MKLPGKNQMLYDQVQMLHKGSISIHIKTSILYSQKIAENMLSSSTNHFRCSWLLKVQLTSNNSF